MTFVETESAVDTHTPTFPAWPTLYGWGFLPVAAVLGGAWAFAAPLKGDVLIATLTALVLALAGWLPSWRAVTRTPWTETFALWRTWEREVPLPLWPYLQPGTPGAALHRALRQARAWWSEVGRAALAAPLCMAVLALSVSVLTALVLGRDALILTLAMVAWTEIAVLWHEGRGDVGAAWAAGALVGLPWLLGASLSPSADTTATLQPVLSALALTLLVAFYAYPGPSAALGPLFGGGFLVWQGQFLAAGGVLLLALPGLLLLLQRPPTAMYRRALAPWLLAVILLMAGVL
ncbi:MAG: hypothetical protein JXR84_06240 [Anaerolineae bacterium]|nr:hypothetical protein [Anaerolineae bacterium]